MIRKSWTPKDNHAHQRERHRMKRVECDEVFESRPITVHHDGELSCALCGRMFEKDDRALLYVDDGVRQYRCRPLEQEACEDRRRPPIRRRLREERR